MSYCMLGGEGGIRTPDTVARMPHFECGAIDHSATSPTPEKSLKKPDLDGCYLTKQAKTDKALQRYIVRFHRKTAADRQDHARRPEIRPHPQGIARRFHDARAGRRPDLRAFYDGVGTGT